MNATRLTDAQKRALLILADSPVSYTVWGNELFTPLPSGIKSRGTLWALHRHGLVRTWVAKNSTMWAITDAGRAALSKAQVQS